MQGGVTKAVLEKERNQEQDADETGASCHSLEVRRAEQRVSQDAQVEHGLRGAHFHQGERGEQDEPGHDRRQDSRCGPAVARARVERVHHQREAEPGQHEAGQVEPAGGVLTMLRQERGAEGERGHSHRHVDVEDPPPGQSVHDRAAEHRAGRRGQQRGHHQQPGGPDALSLREGPVEHGHAHRDQHAGARALDRSAGDQFGQAVRGAAGRRGRGEQGQGPGQDALAAGQVAEPARGGHDHGHRHQVAGDHRAHRRRGHPELPAQRRQGHVDDGGIHDGHEHDGDEDDADGKPGISGVRPARPHSLVKADRGPDCSLRDPGGSEVTVKTGVCAG